MKKNFEKLDLTLKYLINNEDEMGIEATEIYKNLGETIDISDHEQWKILIKLERDGFIKRHMKTQRRPDKTETKTTTKIFSSTFDGLLFIENGGYKIDFSNKKRDKLHSKISQWFNIVWKPFAVIIGILTIFKLVTSVIDYFSK